MKTMFKLILTTLTAGLLITCAALTTSAADADLTVKVSGTVVNFPDQEPTIQNNRTLVPVRFIAESLGYDVEWNPDDRSVDINNGKIIMNIDSTQAVIHGKCIPQLFRQQVQHLRIHKNYYDNADYTNNTDDSFHTVLLHIPFGIRSQRHSRSGRR